MPPPHSAHEDSPEDEIFVKIVVKAPVIQVLSMVLPSGHRDPEKGHLPILPTDDSHSDPTGLHCHALPRRFCPINFSLPIMPS
jgi:hypothetical protein